MSETLPYRSDIDGLRCFAVSAVVLFHSADALAPSGYVGVDIFFAISGYLIGGIVYREANDGLFRFSRFYARRARRILPALLLVIATTLALGMGFLSTREMMMLAGSSSWALLGISNIFFWRHIDYFAPTADQNPLLMTWSLGVEEQFYLLFPILVLLLVSRSRRAVLPSILAICAVSLAVSVIQSTHYPLAGYYLLPSRIWELGLGCALAIIHADRASRPPMWETSNFLGLTGLTGLFASVFLFRSDTAFPGFAALLPVLATLALLHTRGSVVNRLVLQRRPFVQVGLVSYSWYLWHWPLLTFVRLASNGTASIVVTCTTSLIALGLALLSWRYIETPFRKPSWPVPRALLGYGSVLVASLLLIQAMKLGDMVPARLPRMADRIDEEIRGNDACLTPFGVAALPSDSRCRPPNATIALVGDSHAAAMAPGLGSYLKPRALELAQYMKPSCSPLKGFGRVSRLHSGADAECIVFNREVLAALAADDRIKTVILAGFWPEMGDPKIRRLSAGGSPRRDSGKNALAAGLADYVDDLRHNGKRVVLVQDVPFFRENPARFLLSEEIPLRKWVGQIASSAPGQPAVEDYLATRRQVAGIAGQRPDVVLIDTFDQLCGQHTCRIAERGLPLFRDEQHLSLIGSAAIDWSALAVSPTPLRLGFK